MIILRALISCSFKCFLRLDWPLGGTNPNFSNFFFTILPNKKKQQNLLYTEAVISRKKNFKLIHLTPVWCVILSASISAHFWRLAKPRNVSFPRKRVKEKLHDWWIAIRWNRIRYRERRRNSCFRTIWHEKQWRVKKKTLDENFSYSYYTRWHTLKRTRTHNHAIQKVGVRYGVYAYLYLMSC